MRANTGSSKHPIGACRMGHADDMRAAVDPKPCARLNAMRFVLYRLPYAKKDIAVIGPLDPLIVRRPTLVPGGREGQLSGNGSA